MPSGAARAAPTSSNRGSRCMVALEVRETKRWQWGVRNIYVGGARSRVRWRAGETGGEDHEVLVKHGCSAPPPSRDPRCAGKQPDRHAQVISPGGTVNSSFSLQCHFQHQFQSYLNCKVTVSKLITRASSIVCYQANTCQKSGNNTVGP